jgi:hypothetical protein
MGVPVGVVTAATYLVYGLVIGNLLAAAVAATARSCSWQDVKAGARAWSLLAATCSAPGAWLER